MTSRSALTARAHVPAVEPDLMGSAIFLFAEYLARLEAEAPPPRPEDEEDEEDTARRPEIETKAVLDMFAEELGASVPMTLNLYLRVTALYRLLAASPSLARLAIREDGGSLTEDALLAAARLDLTVVRAGGGAAADFDPREFRETLTGR
jgi:hypothetical protein